MVTRLNLLSVTSPENHTLNLVQSFLKGDLFVSKLANRVFKTYDPVYPLTYEETLKEVKAILNKSKVDYVFKGVCRINTAQNLSDAELAVMVRYVNICRQGKLIVVINREIVFIPEAYEVYQPGQVQEYVSKVVAEADRYARLKRWMGKGREDLPAPRTSTTSPPPPSTPHSQQETLKPLSTPPPLKSQAPELAHEY